MALAIPPKWQRTARAFELHASGPGLITERRAVHHGLQFVHKSTIPPTPLYLFPHESKSAFGWHRFALWTIRGKRVINIRGLENSRRQRDGSAFQAVWIPTAVHFLVVVPDDGQDGSKRL